MQDDDIAARQIMLDRLKVDLMGPDSPEEKIYSRPSDVYLTGILWPQETVTPEDEAAGLGAGEEDGESGGEEEQVPVVGLMRPCVAGLSFVISGASAFVNLSVQTALYEQSEDEEQDTVWCRKPVRVDLTAVDCSTGTRKMSHPGLPPETYLHVVSDSWLSKSANLVTITFVNGARPVAHTRNSVEAITLFQFEMKVTAGTGARLVPRPNRRQSASKEDISADLLFRHAHEYAVGHTCSADWQLAPDGSCEWVSTAWMPSTVVPGIRPGGHELFSALAQGSLQPLSAAWIAGADTPVLRAALALLPAIYREWIDTQRKAVDTLDKPEREAALANCEGVAKRLQGGIEAICADADLAVSFRMANLVMNTVSLWNRGKDLTWYPFQLAFLILAAPSAVNRGDSDRTTMDLLWFPTGGGKTEAYLGLIAFTSFARRLRYPGRQTGTAAIMRYTLRLLTTQQFERASAMILAAEALRQGFIKSPDDVSRLGPEPFGIGLWVGGEATPNYLDEAVRNLRGDERVTAVQIDVCPCCKKDLQWKGQNNPPAIHVSCINAECTLHRIGNLPVFTVDENIYPNRPTLLIGTVDKFAQVLRKQDCGPLLAAGTEMVPDLVIQDELHLISGPLGSVVGLYEAGIDLLLTHNTCPPKVIGSTATIKRAGEQVRALFNRDLCQFPPPAINASDSGFAVVDPSLPGRLYVGVTTAGRSAKFTLQAVSGSLLQSALGALKSTELRDPYWTLLVYFNSLRELGGAVVLMQDDVSDAIRLYAKRHREQNRRDREFKELTSRVSQKRVKEMLQEMQKSCDRNDALTAVLASNMLSVGVDIPRLGLMVVNGQPKGISEYIQATSRVGRSRPGLVVSILNNAKARDRSHFETFKSWHQTLYRDVEATSVTPFAPRARDKALHAALLVAARHLVSGMSASPSLNPENRKELLKLVDLIVARAERIDPSESGVRAELLKFIRYWEQRVPSMWWEDNESKFSKTLLVSAEVAVALKAKNKTVKGAKSTPNSMRNVEAGVPFSLRDYLAYRTAADE